MPYDHKKEHIVEKIHYKIGDVAKELGVATSLLRFWEAEFKFAISRTKKGNRSYSIKNYVTILKIYQLVKIEGYTLKGAKRQLRMARTARISWNKLYKPQYKSEKQLVAETKKKITEINVLKYLNGKEEATN